MPNLNVAEFFTCVFRAWFSFFLFKKFIFFGLGASNSYCSQVAASTNAPKVQPAPSPAISTAPVFEPEGNVEMQYASPSQSNGIPSRARRPHSLQAGLGGNPPPRPSAPHPSGPSSRPAPPSVVGAAAAVNRYISQLLL